MARTGLVLYHGVASGAGLKRYAGLADDAGFDSLWVTERYFHEETFSLLGFLAASTERIKLGVGVTNAYTRHPALLAMGAATLAAMSSGRFMLGLGASERGVIEGRMGIPYGSPRAATRQTIAVIRRLLAGEAVTTRSARLNLKNVRLAGRGGAGRVPIYMAAMGPKALRLAGAVADGVLLNSYVPTGYVRYAVKQVRAGARGARRASGRPIDIACMLAVRLTDDPASLRGGMKERLARLLAEPRTGELVLRHGGFDPSILAPLRKAAARGDGAAAAALVSDDLVEALFVVGAADRCRLRIEEYRAAGVDLPLLLPRLEDYPAVVDAFRPQAGLVQ